MALYEIGMSFSTSSDADAEIFYQHLKQLMKKYPHLFKENFPPLEVYYHGEEENDEDEYYDSSENDDNDCDEVF